MFSVCFRGEDLLNLNYETMNTKFTKERAKDALSNFKEYYDDGLISSEEYEHYKQEILNLLQSGILNSNTLRPSKVLKNFESQLAEIFEVKIT